MPNLTLQQVQDMSLQLMNQYSISGKNIAASYNNQQDYLNRIPLLVNDAQNYIATTAKKIFAQYTLVQNPIPNALSSSGDMFATTQHNSTDVSFTATSGKAYYFEIDKSTDVYIESGGVLIKHLTPTVSTKGFSAFKGFTDATGSVTIRFSGSYPYAIRNVCLYNATFQSTGSIPPYKKYNTYEMNDDFFQLVGRGIPYTIGDEFTLSREYKWMGFKTLLIESSLKGEWSVDYYRYPTQVDKDTPLSSELDNLPEAQLCVPYYVASHLLLQSEPALSQVLMNEFELKLSRIGENVQSEVNTIEDVYSGINAWGC